MKHILLTLFFALTICFPAFAVDLADPGADAILMWDDDDDPEEEFATLGTGLSFSGSALSVDGSVLTGLNGENIDDDTIDDDSIDWTDVTLADITFDVGSVSTTEFGYLDGVTSAIQTQLDRKYTSQAYTGGETQATVTEAHMKAARYLTDQGGSAETDLILTAVSYYIDNIIVDTEGNGFEICPPSGEALYLDGTAITADHCVDETGSVGNKALLSRQQIADGTYKYFITTVSGIWADGNDTGD